MMADTISEFAIGQTCLSVDQKPVAGILARHFIEQVGGGSTIGLLHNRVLSRCITAV